MIKDVAIIGGGFSGLCVASTLIQLLKNKKKHVSIMLFDPNQIDHGKAFNINLPNSFKLNHEANYMGVINPFSLDVNHADFFNWIQENKNKKLAILKGEIIKNKYKDFELNNPNSYLPRSLYAYYLKYRFGELLSNTKTENYSFAYKKHLVNYIVKTKNGFRVSYNNTSSTFRVVVLCTGEYFSYDESNIFYSSKPHTYLNNQAIKFSQEIGILGSSLSAVETAIALAERGYKKITMFSRNGRLPKVRGKTLPYKPKYLNLDVLKSLKNNSNTIELKKFIPLLKKEFDYAYKFKNSGLYQKSGINWNEILTNTNPIKQLEEDIEKAQLGKEYIWRSVLSGVHYMEMDVWYGLSIETIKGILGKYSSLILSYFSPMPLVQAEKLQVFLKSKTIRLIDKISHYENLHNKWIVYLKDNKKISVDFLIDARGYSQDASRNLLLTSLIDSGLLERHPIQGIRVNKKFQVIKDNMIIDNIYAVGPMLYGERPLKASTIFFTQYAKQVASNIVERI